MCADWAISIIQNRNVDQCDISRIKKYFTKCNASVNNTDYVYVCKCSFTKTAGQMDTKIRRHSCHEINNLYLLVSSVTLLCSDDPWATIGVRLFPSTSLPRVRFVGKFTWMTTSKWIWTFHMHKSELQLQILSMKMNIIHTFLKFILWRCHHWTPIKRSP